MTNRKPYNISWDMHLDKGILIEMWSVYEEDTIDRYMMLDHTFKTMTSILNERIGLMIEDPGNMYVSEN